MICFPGDHDSALCGFRKGDIAAHIIPVRDIQCFFGCVKDLLDILALYCKRELNRIFSSIAGISYFDCHIRILLRKCYFSILCNCRILRNFPCEINSVHIRREAQVGLHFLCGRIAIKHRILNISQEHLRLLLCDRSNRCRCLCIQSYIPDPDIRYIGDQLPVRLIQ